MRQSKITAKFVSGAKTKADLKACIQELNRSAILARELSSDVVEEIKGVGPGDAFEILMSLESGAAEIHNPDSYGKAAVKQK